MRPSGLIARLASAGSDLDARVGWRLGRVPSFDARRAAGPFTTLVAFLPEPVAGELADMVAGLPALAAHFRYPPGQLHVTIRNLDGAALATLPQLLDGLQPISLRADRLGFTRQTLLLRMTTADTTLRRLRTRLDELPGAQPSRLPRRDLVFANVLRLNGPVAAELRRSVSRRGDALVGRRLDIDELTLLRTDKVGSPERTEVLDRFRLPWLNDPPRPAEQS
jgi:hypothetical protein